ncbi:MAG: hypothetical protein J4F36_12165 [Nitrosopumilaceae archaeon]|nr:hypothetical protein [Nitrosopumilaceae archaeon]
MIENFKINIRARILYIIAAVAGFYLLSIPLTFLTALVSYFSILSPGVPLVGHIAKITFAVLMLYMAFVKTKPSLVPLSKQYKTMVLGLAGFGNPNAALGMCYIDSNVYSYDEENLQEHIGGMTSVSPQTSQECLNACKDNEMSDDKTCSFDAYVGEDWDASNTREDGFGMITIN